MASRSTTAIEADLALLRTARSNLLSGGAVKSFSLAGKSFQFASLGELTEAENGLLSELGDAENPNSVILPDLTRRAL